MFAGPSGTGKTFASEVVANALGWPLFRVDLGMQVSKYVGETEYNLNAFCDGADGQPLVLLFDDADGCLVSGVRSKMPVIGMPIWR